MIVQVSKGHIKRGTACSSLYCPVALAIKCAIEFRSDVVVSPKNRDLRGGIKIGDKHYLAPRSVERFVKRFDHIKPVKPFNFKLKEA